MRLVDRPYLAALLGKFADGLDVISYAWATTADERGLPMPFVPVLAQFGYVVVDRGSNPLDQLPEREPTAALSKPAVLQLGLLWLDLGQVAR